MMDDSINHPSLSIQTMVGKKIAVKILESLGIMWDQLRIHLKSLRPSQHYRIEGFKGSPSCRELKRSEFLPVR